MEILIQIQAAEDTSVSEVAAISSSLREQIRRLQAVDSLKAVLAPSPEGSKGGIAELGMMLVNLPAGAITGILDLVKAYLTRPGAPPVTIKVTKDGIEGIFDPRAVTPDEFAALAAKLAHEIKSV